MANSRVVLLLVLPLPLLPLLAHERLLLTTPLVHQLLPRPLQLLALP